MIVRILVPLPVKVIFTLFFKANSRDTIRATKLTMRSMQAVIQRPLDVAYL